MKKLFAIIMCVMMVMCFMPSMAFASGDTDYVAKDSSDKVYKTLQAAVDGVPNCGTITLLRDVKDGTGVATLAGNVKDFTIDFAGHTYTVSSNPVGSGSYKTQGFHFEKPAEGNVNVTLKNGTITSAADSGVKMLVQNYCNLTLDNMTLDGRNLQVSGRYVLSNNCGDVRIEDTTITAKEGDFAFDVCWAETYEEGANVTVTGSSVINGDVELGLWGNENYEKSESVLAVENGTFNGSIKPASGHQADEVANNVHIKGGTFSQMSDEDLEKFVPGGYEPKNGKVEQITKGEPAFYPAILNDEDGSIAAQDLIEDYNVEATKEKDSNWYDVKITGKNLERHTNGKGKEGYWVGFALVAPEGADEVSYSFNGQSPDDGPVALEPSVAKVDGEVKDGIAFYVDASNTYDFYGNVSWLNEDGIQVGETVDFCAYLEVSLNSGDVYPAILHDNSEPSEDTLCDSYSITKIRDEYDSSYYRIDVSNLKKHGNGNNEGYWVGIAITAPEGADKVSYKFNGQDGSPDNLEPSVAEVNGKAKDGIAFYVDASKDKFINAEVKWYKKSEDEKEVELVSHWYNVEINATLEVEDIYPAILHDNSVPPKKVLYDGDSYKVSSDLKWSEKVDTGDNIYEYEEEEIDVSISAKDLEKHVNGNGKLGYWIGFAVVAPTDAAEFALSTNDSDETIWGNVEPNITEDGKSGVAVYFDALKTKTSTIYLEWFREEENKNELKSIKWQSFNVDLDRVTLAGDDMIGTATLCDTRTGSEKIEDKDLCNNYDIEVQRTVGNGYTDVYLKADDLRKHQNGENKMGYWIGAAVQAPENATKVLYATAKSNEKLQSASTRTIGLEDLADGKRGIAYYVDADDKTARWLKVQWVNENNNDNNIIIGEETIKLNLDAVNLYTPYSGGGVVSPTGDEEVEAVEALINEIKTSESKNEEKILLARAAYDKLTPEQQKMVSNYSDLTTAEKQLKEDNDKIEKEQREAAIKALKDSIIKARSVKTSKGNIKVTAAAPAKTIKALKDAGYTVKYKFYRSIKKASKYAAKLQKTTNTYINTTGKKGVRYYYKAIVKVYDEDGKLVANTSLKNCRYACRVK